jgi:DNA-binding MarR family transcriptional regulator
VTPSGDEVALQILKIDEKLRAELRVGISRKERRELTQLLNRVRENVGGVFLDDKE